MADKLCRICSKVPFDRYLRGPIKEAINLGTWEDILRSKRCPFCRLVASCIRSKYSLTLPTQNSDILLTNELSWKLGIEYSPYERSKSESYSNKFDLRSKAQQRFQDVYRFVVVAKEDISDPLDRSRCGIIQHIADENIPKEDRQFFGRRIASEAIDLDVLDEWLDGCSDWHGYSCKQEDQPFQTLPSNLRLIDVKRKRIIKASEHGWPQYVAMSYVWGKSEMEMESGRLPSILTARDIVRTTYEERTPLPANLPRTIEDAMSITRRIGYRYLWNDALCIIQDSSAEEKRPHLASMKHIYGSARLTIAAAAGSHVDHGLPGVSVPRRHRQYSEMVGSIELATMFPTFSELEGSSLLAWNSRGWTFQEKLLSRRLLLFTDFQLYFRCGESVWTEEIALETQRLSKSVEARPAKFLWMPNRQSYEPSKNAEILHSLNGTLNIKDEWDYPRGFLDYTTAVSEYTKRTLSDNNDMLVAIDGVLQDLEQCLGRCYFGLPEKHFLESLLWYPEPGSTISNNESGNFPTWSWASLVTNGGKIMVDVPDIRSIRRLIETSVELEEDIRTLRSYDDTFRRRRDKYIQALNGWGFSANLCASFAWPILQKNHTVTQMYIAESAGCQPLNFDLPMNVLKMKATSDEQLRGTVFSAVQQFAKLGDDAWKPCKRSQIVCRRDKRPALIFKTVVVRFCIGKQIGTQVSAKENEAQWFELLTADGCCIGKVNTARGRANQQSGMQDFLTIACSFSMEDEVMIHPSYIPYWKFNSLRDGPDGLENLLSREAKFELLLHDYGAILPAICGVKKGWKTKVSSTLNEDLSLLESGHLYSQVFFAKKGQQRPRKLWPVVNLVLVDWHKGKAHRVGVGKIMMKAWQEQWSLPQEIIFV